MISILMPAKNAEKHIEECLQSIINQSFEDWELIVVNDNSKDKTEKILQNFSQKENRIQYFNNSGNGIIDALQMAYSISSGNAITRMDSDDIMPSKKMEWMQESLKENQNSLITGYVEYISDNELKMGYQYYQNWLNRLVDEKRHYREIYKECVIPSPCWMVSREVFESCGAFYSEIYPEDYDLTFRFYENKVPIVGIQKVLHVWRDHSERASRNDENYSDNSFIDIKMKYFLKLDIINEKRLVLWGAGKKAKKIALILVEKNIDFVWACNNFNKIGKEVYSQRIQNIETVFQEYTNYQTIITVANKEAQKEISESLKNKKNIEAFWFC